MRLLTEGVYFRNRDTSSSVGVPQMLLGLAVLILAGLVLGGGAIVLLGNTRPSATPTGIAAGATGTPLLTSSAATPSAAFTPTLPPTPTLISTATPFLPTPTPSPAPTPTAEPTPAPTPVDCAVASQGSNVKHFQLGPGRPTKALPKTWCIRHVTIDQWFGPGTARLLRNNQVVFEASCLASPCAGAERDFDPPYQADSGKTLRYEFDCIDDPATGTPESPVNECTDGNPDGAVITIDYEPFAAP